MMFKLAGGIEIIIDEIFRVRKPLIGVVHLLPLPGAPKCAYSMKEIIERAVKDAKAYQNGGLDGIIVGNFGDRPFYPESVGPETIAAMSVVTSRIVSEVEIPVGVNVLRNDPIAAIAIAHAAGCRFIRVNVLTEVMITDQGIIQATAHNVLRFRKLLNAENVKIFADVHVKHAIPMMNRPIEQSAVDLVERGLADAVIVTGETTGRKPNIGKVHRVKMALKTTPVIVGSGVTEDNVAEYLQMCDGVIVGTSLKRNNITENPVDIVKVKEFVKRANEVR